VAGLEAKLVPVEPRSPSAGDLTQPGPADPGSPRPVTGQRRGILVTGLPRSGTSWTGKMLEASGEVVYVNEPLNPHHPPGRSPGVLNAEISHRFQYICADNEATWLPAFTDTLRLRYHLVAELRRNHAGYDLARTAKYLTAFTGGRLRGRRALIDDPFATLSVAWFARRLGCQVVVCVRHPVSFVGSWRRFGWDIEMDDLLGQPLLVRDLIGPYSSDLEAAKSADPVTRVAQLWRVAHAALAEITEREPGLLRVQRYEDLAKDPETGFRGLYEVCCLDWTEQARQRVAAATTGQKKSEGVHSWTLRGGLSRTAFQPMDSRAALGTFRDRLSEQEIARVLEVTADVAGRYYPEGLESR
jgi:hypothetical protein